jgi:hypothetical protein
MDLYYSVTDAVTIADIKAAYAEDNPGKKFPVPDVRSAREGKGDRKMVVVQPTPEQCSILAGIVDGFNSLDGIKDPYERNKERLRLMDRARKVSLDPRAVHPHFPVESAGGKIAAVVDRVARIYEKWDADKGTQLVFLDRSVPKAKGDDKIVEAYDAVRARLAKAQEAGDEREEQAALDALDSYNANEIEALRAALNGGWNAYDEIKRQLVAKGIPASEIRFVQEAGSDKQKEALFEQVRRGEVRVLLGSTQRMGAGTNVQNLLVGLHHIDVTWKPSDVEQREGRAVRQGNELLEKYGDDFAVEVIAYATERTIDAKMWSLNATKLKSINAIRNYDGSFEMEFEDRESASMAEMAALATGNPLMVERVVLTSEIQKLELQERAFKRRINALRDEVHRNTRHIEDAPAKIERYNDFAEAIEEARKGIEERCAARSITVNGKPYDSALSAEAAADAAIASIRGGDTKARFSIEVGGVKLTAKDKVEAAILEAFGTKNFEAEVDGITYTGVTAAARAIAEKASAMAGDSITVDGIKIDGIAVEADIAPPLFTKYDRSGSRLFDAKDCTFAAIDSAGRTMVECSTELSTGNVTSSGVWRSVLAIHEMLDADRFRDRAEEVQSKAAAAEKDLPRLMEQAEKPWDKAGELKEKRVRIQDVVAELTAEATQAQQEGETTEADPETGTHVLPDAPKGSEAAALAAVPAPAQDGSSPEERREAAKAEIEAMKARSADKGRAR